MTVVKVYKRFRYTPEVACLKSRSRIASNKIAKSELSVKYRAVWAEIHKHQKYSIDNGVHLLNPVVEKLIAETERILEMYNTYKDSHQTKGQGYNEYKYDRYCNGMSNY